MWGRIKHKVISRGCCRAAVRVGLGLGWGLTDLLARWGAVDLADSGQQGGGEEAWRRGGKEDGEELLRLEVAGGAEWHLRGRAAVGRGGVRLLGQKVEDEEGGHEGCGLEAARAEQLARREGGCGTESPGCEPEEREEDLAHWAGS